MLNELETQLKDCITKFEFVMVMWIVVHVPAWGNPVPAGVPAAAVGWGAASRLDNNPGPTAAADVAEAVVAPVPTKQQFIIHNLAWKIKIRLNFQHSIFQIYHLQNCSFTWPAFVSLTKMTLPANSGLQIKFGKTTCMCVPARLNPPVARGFAADPGAVKLKPPGGAAAVVPDV